MKNKTGYWNKIEHKIYPWVKQMLYDSDLIGNRNISIEETPLISFVGNLLIVFVIKQGDQFELLKEEDVPVDIGMEAVYDMACKNLVRDVEFSFSRTLYGGFGVLADGQHEASSLCFQHIWSVCCEKLGGDLIIAVPSKDTVLFSLLSEKEQLEELKKTSDYIYNNAENKISKDLFRFSQQDQKLSVFKMN